MSDHTTSLDLNESQNELKEKVYSKDDGWFVKSCYMEDYGLSFVDAGLYTILTNLGKKRGYANPFNSTICNILGIKERCLRDKLDLLKEKGILYIHYYQTQTGKKREMITIPNAALYYNYLKKNNKHQQLNKFTEEFLGNLPEPNPPPPPQKSAAAKSSVAPTPSAKSADPGAAKSAGALNTTYLEDRTSDATCKSSDEPAASDEACSAAVSDSDSELRKELEMSFSKADCDIGMQWYAMQTEAKKATMKKPIACIINALKGGYAQEEVASKNTEVAAQLKKEESVNRAKENHRGEMNKNEQLARFLVKKAGEYPGMKYQIDSKCLVVKNENAVKSRVDDPTSPFHGGLCFVMPSGDIWHGANGIRVDFDMPHNRFTQDLKKYFDMSQWSKESKRKTNP